MKIFNSGEDSAWDKKVNFVDDNNTFVGYDMSRSCCEHADWFISNTEDNKPLENEKGEYINGIIDGLEDYFFDVLYFVNVEPQKDKDSGYTYLDSGGMVRFKIVAKDKEPLYLHIYNSHNGYYGHGFESGRVFP